MNNSIAHTSAKYTALEIAQYIIGYCAKNSVSVTNMKLQKLLYFVYGYYYVKFDRPLFDGGFEAWRYGPVNVEVYDEYSVYGGFPISTDVPDSEFSGIGDIGDLRCIDKSLNDNMKRDTFDLVNDTHKEGYAWEKTIGSMDNFSHSKIPDNYILEEFKDRNK